MSKLWNCKIHLSTDVLVIIIDKYEIKDKQTAVHCQ